MLVGDLVGRAFDRRQGVERSITYKKKDRNNKVPAQSKTKPQLIDFYSELLVSFVLMHGKYKYSNSENKTFLPSELEKKCKKCKRLKMNLVVVCLNFVCTKMQVV